MGPMDRDPFRGEGVMRLADKKSSCGACAWLLGVMDGSQVLVRD